MYTQVLKALETTKDPTILVVGDLMLDRYLWGDVERISPEAPVPVVQIDRARTHTTVGGAGSVMRDLVALGAKVIAAGVVGDDDEGREVPPERDVLQGLQPAGDLAVGRRALGALVARGEVGVERRGLGRRQLPEHVSRRVLGEAAGGWVGFRGHGFRCSRSASMARKSRDFTVPTGMSRTSAISCRLRP